MRTTLRALLLTALTLSLAACDDGDGTDEPTDTSPADTASGDTVDDATTSPDTTTPDDTATPDTDGDDTTQGDDVTDTGDDVTDTTVTDTAVTDAGDLDDDGDVVMGSALATCIEGVPPEGQTVEMMTFESADGAVQVGYARRVSGVGVGETWTFDLMRFGVVREGQLECIDDPARLEHLEGHHNWNETLTATADDDTVYTLRMMVDFTDGFDWTDWLESTGPRAFAAQVDLEATGCQTDPGPDPNFCFSRETSPP